jgi:hypothetical protein
VSINPTDIIGAKELWVYNIKSRKVGKYVANEYLELGVKGTSITGFNSNLSVQKTLRKPEEQLKEFKAAGKVQLRKFLDDIKDVDINKLHLGHCQAPTSSIRKWKDSDAHPFVYENWIVAHNGVLTNAEQLTEKYNLQVQSKVDTAVIPALLHTYEQQDQQTVVSCIKNTLSELKGTFGLWIVHKKTKQVFLARQGSTIFANMSTGSFCSLPCKNKEWCELGEGCIYKIDIAEKNIEPIEKFTTDSPFLFIAESEDT